MNYVQSGKAFEIQCSRLLKRFGFALDVVGRAGDRGIDLKGGWQLEKDYKVNVYVQCKNTKNKISSVRIRELEGALCRTNSANCVGFLMANNVPTSDAIEALNCSKFALGFMLIKGGVLTKILLNSSTQQLLPHFYTFQQDMQDNSLLKLFWKGKVIDNF